MADEKPEYEDVSLHPKERELIELIRDLRFGYIKDLKVHEGLPELVDVEATRRYKFKG